jgi:hypothetical protein
VADPRHTANSRGYVFDSSVAAWIPDPKTAAGVGGAGSTQVAVSSVAGVVAIEGNSTVHQGTSPWVITGNSTIVETVVSTTARASVTQSSTSVTLQSSNADRLGWSVYNRPTQAAELYIKLGTTASTSDYDVIVQADQYYELPIRYTGRIDGIWSSTGTGFARVCEFLA